MAKLKSLIKIEGTLDGLTFYKGKDGYLVRTKGGVSKNRIQNDPAFIRTRENGTEFGHIAKSGKILRQAITPLLADVKDSRVSSRLTKAMGLVKNADVSSARGQRQVGVGITTTEGKNALQAFDFNNNAPLDSVLYAEYQVDTTTGEVSILNLTPSQDINAPGGATHVSCIAGVLNLDFTTEEKELILSPEANLPLNGTVTNINITPATMPVGTGQMYYFLKLAFYQEVNGTQYALNNGAYNVLQILDIV